MTVADIIERLQFYTEVEVHSTENYLLAESTALFGYKELKPVLEKEVAYIDIENNTLHITVCL